MSVPLFVEGTIYEASATKSRCTGTTFRWKIDDFRLPAGLIPEMIMKSQFLACLSFAKSEWRWGCMKRWLMAVAALLCLSEVTARADYFIIKVNLASTKEKAQTNNNAMAQQPGATGLMPGQGMGGAAGFGARGGMPGMSMPGMGMPGAGMGMGGRGGRGGKGGGMGSPGAQAWECLAAWAVATPWAAE